MFPTLDSAVNFVYRHFTSPVPAPSTDSVRHPELIARVASILKIRIPSRVIVVTGSKGKGSTSVLTAAALSSQVQGVGLFTGPQLLHYEERIRIDGKAIASSALLRHLNLLAPVLSEFDQLLPQGIYLGPVGQFLLAALSYFSESGVDTAVLECGRGALFDEVNTVPHQVAVIGPLFCEHPRELGDSIAEVAKHKAAVAVGARFVVSAAQEPAGEEVIHRYCELFGAELLTCGQEFSLQKASGYRFNVSGRFGSHEQLRTSMAADYQAENAAAALVAAELLLGGPIDPIGVWDRISWPGRMQRIPRTPPVVLDGAVSRRSVGAVRDFLQQEGARRIVAVIAVPEDKDYMGVITEASQFSEALILTTAGRPRLRYAQDAVRIAAEASPSARFIESPAEAFRLADQLVAPDGFVAILGTQSLMGEALGFYGVETRDIY